jgi:tight adherence protein C
VNLELVSVIVGLFVFAGIFAALYVIFIRAANVRDRINPQDNENGGAPRRAAVERVLRLFRPLGELIPRSPEDMSQLERRIAQAGIRHPDSAILFVGIQVATALAMFVLMGAVPVLVHHLPLRAVLALFMGAMIPDVILRRMTANRQELIQMGLPDVLDLTVICVEAGLGLDQSLQRVGQEVRLSHSDLSDELRLTNLEINMGRSRADALRNLGRRTGVDDLKALCAVLIQTDRFGTSVGQALRVYSDSLRTKRRQRAEERAAKLPVKIIPPLVLFVFPAIFVVVAGPAVIAIVRDFLPMMNAR